MNIIDAIKLLEERVPNPSEGLPDEIFYYASRLTPLVNVDLLVKDKNNRVLLSWRHDRYAGEGWHLPGGIVRFRETLEERVRKVAEKEIGVAVDFDPVPVEVNQIIIKEIKDRSHFISILYNCRLSADFVPENKRLAETDAGYLKWHDGCPDDLLKLHNIYRKFL
jgi:colanic acid biosynthesis protein WcaH